MAAVPTVSARSRLIMNKAADAYFLLDKTK